MDLTTVVALMRSKYHGGGTNDFQESRFAQLAGGAGVHNIC
jgi:hypothetical protein